MNSTSCDARVQASMASGSCGRPNTGFGNNDCSNNDSSCQRKYGHSDGSRWCADNSDGCCNRFAPPLKNQFKCCTSMDLMDAKTCGNEWCPQSDACRGILGPYCGDPANVTKPECQLFCSKEENKGFCDEAMRKYCVSNRFDQLCTCIMADLDGVPAPSCFNAGCTSTGYQTLDHINQASNCPAFCGSIIDCQRSGTCKITDNNFLTYCCAQHPELCSEDNRPLWQKIYDWIVEDPIRKAGALLFMFAFAVALLSTLVGI